MSKKMFAFGGLTIALVIGLFCMVSSFASFTNVALLKAFEGNAGSQIAYGIGYLLTGLLLIGLALIGIVLSIIFLIRNKEPKFPIVPIIVLACAAVLLLSYDIMNMVGNGTTITNSAKNIKDASQDMKPYYGVTIFTSLLSILTNLCVTLIVAALGVFSLITFKKKKAEETQPAE